MEIILLVQAAAGFICGCSVSYGIYKANMYNNIKQKHIIFEGSVYNISKHDIPTENQ